MISACFMGYTEVVCRASKIAFHLELMSPRTVNIHTLYQRRQEPTTIVLWKGHLTDKSDDRLGHLNTI